LKPAHRQRHSRPAPPPELAELRTRLAEAEDTLRAIGSGEVDAVVVAGKQGDRVFTLEGAEHAYRVLIESMNEGALTLTADTVILYANQCFARMVKQPLETVTGSSFRRFLSAEDQATLRPLMKRADKSGTMIRAQIIAGDGSQMPAQISIRPMARNGVNHATIGMVVTNMTEARRAEEMLRALTHRVVHAQEVERGRVALELHDNITQLLCAVHFRSQALADGLSARDGPLKGEATRIREMLGKAAKEVERIARNLRPSVLGQLGLDAALRSTSTEFADRTGVSVKLAFMPLAAQLPAEYELALYRILQEALKNVEKHARALHVTVCLRRLGAFVQLVIKDDGVGFDPDRSPARRKRKGGLGLLGMRERAAYVGGSLKIKSIRHSGTEIEARVPTA
jgi:PAS domain S-box-containing protein